MNALVVRLMANKATPAPSVVSRNSLQDAVEPVYSVMRLFAAWPAKRPKGGRGSVLTRALLLSVQVACLLLVGYEWVGVLQDRVRYMRRGAGVTRTVLAIQFLLYLAMFFTLPLMWRDAARLPPVWEGWSHVQARLERVCGGRLAASRALSWRLAVLLLLLWPPIVAVPLMLLPEAEMPVRQAWFYAYPTLVTFSLKLLWMRLFTALRHAAELLVSSFRTESRDWSRPDAAARLRTYRELWSSLSGIMQDIGVRGGLSLLCVQAIQVLSLLVCFVHIVISCLEGFTPAGLWIVSLTLTNATTMVALSNAAHSVAHLMREIGSLLETTSTVGLTTAVDYEMLVLRDTLAHKHAAVRLCGFVTVDRELVGEVLVVMMTYLMVLLQFALL
ncbi:gustatory and odorant receptor 21a-like [Frankliniella occidentalis]|uniref:Gustatory receptor n=1 Tax=Frankliniella occidentalis TaxID=133901 RepID=A0A9C6X799_FRAOC|nr:gustatory and odorant receptor 21a-like [Frankliniella occidentalis]